MLVPLGWFESTGGALLRNVAMNPAIDELGAEEIWKEPVDRLLSRLATTAASLDAKEAQVRLKTFGPNNAAVVKRSPLWLQFLSRFRKPAGHHLARGERTVRGNRRRRGLLDRGNHRHDQYDDRFRPGSSGSKCS